MNIITRGQLITIWIIGFIVWVWSFFTGLDSYSTSALKPIALLIFFTLPFASLFYTLGWRKKNCREEAPVKEKGKTKKVVYEELGDLAEIAPAPVVEERSLKDDAPMVLGMMSGLIVIFIMIGFFALNAS